MPTIHSTTQADRVFKMAYMVARMTSGDKFAAWSTYEKKIKTFFKNERQAQNFLKLGDNAKRFQIISLKEFNYRVINKNEIN